MSIFTEAMNIRQREQKGKEKLQKCVVTVQKHLEKSYRIELPNQIDDNLPLYVFI